VPKVIELLGDRDPFTRRAACKALGSLDDDRAAAPLAKLLNEVYLRKDAAAALQALGPKAEKAVLALLQDGMPPARAEACKLLQAIGTGASLPTLEPLAAQKRDPVNRLAASAVQAIRQRLMAEDKAQHPD
jgi:HEAT repeat protein